MRVESTRARPAIGVASDHSDTVVLAVRVPGKAGEVLVRVARGDFNFALSHAGRGQWVVCRTSDALPEARTA